MLAAYRDRLAGRGAAGLLDESLIRPFEIEQECRELIYSARHLPRWRYAPMGVLRAWYPEESREPRAVSGRPGGQARRPGRPWPETLAAADPFAALPAGVERVLFLGMGSSRYAAGVAALRLRAAGVDAYAEYASAAASFPRDARTLVVPISATGGSRETLDAVARHGGGASPVAALTNTRTPRSRGRRTWWSPCTRAWSGAAVACRTFQHTLALLLALESRLTGAGRDVRRPWCGGPPRPRPTCWSAGTSGCRWCWSCSTARTGSTRSRPAERLSSAEQSALMLREGPRRPADACETGDWAHVDVYLTKTLDYRALLFPGSRYDEQAMDWVRQRGSTVVTVGGEVKDATAAVRYATTTTRTCALLTETLVAELVAAYWWAAQ